MSTQQGIYVSQNGKKTQVTNMVNEHLDNAINFCRRKGFRNKYNMLRRERYRRTGQS